MIRNKPRGAKVYGIDLGKNVFHVVGTDSAGNVGQRVKFRRDTLLAFFALAERALVGMEVCPGSQWLARKLQAMGHSVRIIPAQFVKPYVKSNKNDTIDAAAIAEAVTRPTMRFVQVKQPEQVDLQALHRIRDQLVGSRTRLICQMRAFCLEYGVAMRQGAGVFKLDLPRVIADESNDLTPTMRRLLAELFEDLCHLEKRIAAVTREIEALAARDDAVRRLMTVPGIGPLGATALLAAAGNGQQFKKARDMAAWLGLVPQQYSTVGRTQMLGRLAFMSIPQRVMDSTHFWRRSRGSRQVQDRMEEPRSSQPVVQAARRRTATRSGPRTTTANHCIGWTFATSISLRSRGATADLAG